MPLFKFFGILDSDRQLNFRKKPEPVMPITGEDQPLNPYTEIQILSNHKDIIRHLLLIDDRRFVSAGDDTTVLIWDFEYGKVLHILEGHTRPITCMLLHQPSDGLYEKKTLLMTASSDQSLHVWDVNNGRCLRVLKNHERTTRCLTHVEDRRFVCGAGQNLIVWGPHLNYVCAHELINQEDITMLICLNYNQLVGCMNKQLAVFTFSTLAGSTIRGIKFICKLKSHREAVRCLTAINDYSFASGSLDGEVIVWSTSDWAPALHLTAHKQFLRNVALYPFSVQSMLHLSPDDYLAVAVGNGFCVYSTKNGSLLFAQLYAHHSKVQQIELVNSGHLLATCSEDGSIRLWGFPYVVNKHCADCKASLEALPMLIPVTEMCERLKNHPESCAIEEPNLLGEFQHNGSVIKMLSLGRAGFASCGMDQLVILWKDGEYQNSWRARRLLEQHR